jgi:hypothetical protein
MSISRTSRSDRVSTGRPSSVRGEGVTTPSGPNEPALRLARAPEAWLDRALPARPGPFLAVVLGAAALFWGLGWALASDRARLVRNPEWTVQPLYLAVHLVLLRLFVTVYATNAKAGAAHLDVSPEETARVVRRVLGPLGFAVAVLVAAPLTAMDVRWLQGEEYLRTGGHGVGGALGASDWLLAAAWAVEWLVNAYVWVVIVGFLWTTMHLLRRHAFRDPIEHVLRERQYRPFLLMSAQGATLTLVLTAASAAYVLLAEGETSDYVGLWTTAILVFVGFVPPWLQLKKGIGDVVERESEALGLDVETRSAALEAADAEAVAGRDEALERMDARLRLVLAIVRLQHLERLHRELGKSEAQAVLLRLLAPLGTVGWRLFRPF